MKKLTVCILCLLGLATFGYSKEPDMESKINRLIEKMTLEEKIGQLNQLNGGYATGTEDGRALPFEDTVRKANVGSFLNVIDLDAQKKLQKIAVEETRMGIPLLYAYDVIHGFRTIFPVPLAEAASWDLDAIEQSARIAAIEASASGIHWTFAPMVDIARDPRWGRIVEGAGEDSFLGSKIAAARVKGFQSDDLSKPDTIIACAKHFAAYGAAEGGRDYNTVDVSERIMREVYLPPFEAAVKAGARTVMNSFNVLDRMPASGNDFLVKKVLRGEWGFTGFIVSDWNSFGEMVIHGVAKDGKDAARIAISTGSDMDMEAKVYMDYLAELVKEGAIHEKWINESVRRILRIKFELGLFDDPYRYINKDRQKQATMSKENLDAARKIAQKSIVLLKNENQILPLKKDTARIAVIGQLANSKQNGDMMGTWPAQGKNEEVITPFEGIKAKVAAGTEILYASGGNAFGICPKEMIAEAVQTAKKADTVIVVAGENGDMSGESKSRAYLDLPGNQQELIEALCATGKPVVMVLMTGRPLTIPWCDKNVPAIVNAWQLGTMGGHAIADVLFGDYNPSGKLPVSFPVTVGQVPLYYNHLNTGRPRPPQDVPYVSKYIDCPNDPLYPFGYGLSYTTFAYSDVSLSKTSITFNETLNISTDVSNTGKMTGDEVVQMYIRDLVGSVSRPVKELKGFQKIHLQPGEKKTVTFALKGDDLAFWTKDMEFKAEPGEFAVFVGTNSRDVKEATFTLK